MTRPLAVVVFAALATAGMARGEQPAKVQPLTIQVHPRVMSAGDRASVRVRIEPDPLSRTLEIAWWSDGRGGSHQIDVDGDRAAVRHDFPIKSIEAGEYEISAVLTRSDGRRLRRTTSLIVVGH